jgi:hypothetical protein
LEKKASKAAAPVQPSPVQPKLAAAREPERPASNVASLVAAFMQDGEKCFQAKQYDCAIAKANEALKVDPASAPARQLKTAAAQEQQRALKQIKIE